MPKFSISQNLAVFGLTHALIDATSIAVLMSSPNFHSLSNVQLAILIVAYNFLAFALQVPLGLLVDKYRNPVATAVLGALLVGLSTLILPFSAELAVLTAGIGNALFHLGGGTVSLNLIPKTAAPPGIFVAPGAVGVLIGTLVAKSGNFQPIWFLALLLIACIAMLKVRIPKIDYDTAFHGFNPSKLELILLLLFFTVVIRSFAGSVLVFPWKADLGLLVIVTAGVVFGKAVGGVLGDRFGWKWIAVGALVVSAPLITLLGSNPLAGILGLVVFNITMPITLVAISNVLPGRPAFAFGLTCLALDIGTFPVLMQVGHSLGALPVLALILASALALFYGLSEYSKAGGDSFLRNGRES